MTEMNRSEMSGVQGGSDGLRCFLSGVVVGVGVATLQPEIIVAGAVGAYINC